MTAPGRVLDVAGLPLPGGEDTLALVPLERPVFDQLLHEHPAPAGEDRVFDPETLGPALISACAAAPLLTVGEARALFDEWPAGDADAVFDACLDLCLPLPSDRAWWRLEREGRLAAEMAYCAPLGIPHSHFLGGPPGWTDADRDLALAWDARRRATCPGCGTRSDQWAGNPQAFEVEYDDCPGCWLLAKARNKLERDQPQHVHTHLVPATDGDDDPEAGDVP